MKVTSLLFFVTW